RRRGPRSRRRAARAARRRGRPAGARGRARDVERQDRGRGRDRRSRRRFPGAGRGRGMTARHLLILGGTGEAVALARGALARFGEDMTVTTALAGRTRHPGPIPGEVRIGGFGGPGGLAAYLAMRGIDRLIDATHPFAAEISRAARIAADRTGVPRLSVMRPPWRRHPLDRWIEVDSLEAAALLVGRLGRRAWLTVGAGSVAAFASATGVRFLVRLVDPPSERLPLRFYEVVLGRGPFSLA